MPSTMNAVLFLMVISIVSAAPFSYRFRRSADDDSQELSTSPPEIISEDIQPTSSRQGKAINYFSVPANPQDDSKSMNTQSETDTSNNKQRKKQSRQNKALSYFDYIPQFYSGDDDYGDDDLVFDANDSTAEDDALSRTIPSRRKQTNPYKAFGNTNSLTYDNSPIYYIRLPPTPYMFVPGLGYVSQPPSMGPPMAPPVNPFINLPIDFVSNGKPTNIYQWTGAPTYQAPAAIDPYNQVFARPQVSRPRPSRPNDYNNYQRPSSNNKPATDSKVTNLKGPFVFNGKPNDIFVLRDSYNSLYSDALQNFYP